MSIGIIFGSDTGVTESVTDIIVETIKERGKEIDEIKEVCNIENEEDFLKFELLILGLSTWYDGDLQSDWEVYFDKFKSIDFSGKTIALFGLGDQINYGEYYIDGVGMLAKVVLENGGNIIGNWSTEGYEHTESKAEIDENTFYGLALDEDNEDYKTEDRIAAWVDKVLEELG